MKRITKLFAVTAMLVAFSAVTVSAQGLKTAKLRNGLTVFIWEDENFTDVYGMVSVGVGSMNEPAEYTGLAHYLEHVLFKGTEQIGATDWMKELPIYDQIIKKYDELANETNPAKRDEISKEINELTIQQSQLAYATEFNTLTNSIGGTGLNAFTSYDITAYHNSFPASQIGKWLELNSQRFINPVFRSFQSELETVYEEYNMYKDNKATNEREYINGVIYKDHPYGRSVIGLGEHLKNPKLSALIDFYKTWYVAENMTLVLVGNIKTEEILPLVNRYFGRLPTTKSPEVKNITNDVIKGREQVSAKIGLYPSVSLAFNAMSMSDKDALIMEVCCELLSNSGSTGFLDRLRIDGDIMGVSAGADLRKVDGRVVIKAIPFYDANQRRYNSNKNTEKMILTEVKKLADGKIDEALLQTVKNSMCRSFDMMLEENNNLGLMLGYYFAHGMDEQYMVDYKELVNNVSLSDVKRVSRKYLSDNYRVINITEGKTTKREKVDKPDIKPVEMPKDGVVTAYSQWFRKLPTQEGDRKYVNMNEVQTMDINDMTKLFYVENKQNNVFSLIIKYGVGAEKMRKLPYAVQLMNNAGIMGQMEPHEFKQEMSRLNASCNFICDDSNMYVVMHGTEDHLIEACNLMTRQILMPKLEEKQLKNSVVGRALSTRFMEKDELDIIVDAMREYMMYKDNSEYRDRLSANELYWMTIADLTGEFQRATDFSAEVHYTGSVSFDVVSQVLSSNLPLKEGGVKTEGPVERKRVAYSENTIYFYPMTDATQAKIYFYSEGENFTVDQSPSYSVFNNYFSGGFEGLVLSEIREKNSMAYGASGYFAIPAIQNKPTCFLGSIETQPDKAADAIGIYMSLVRDMPQHPDRMEDLATKTNYNLLAQQPSMRYKSITYEEWKQRGYTDDPAKLFEEKLENMTFDDVVKFYETHLKDNKIAIVVVGDPRYIDLKSIEKHGKVERLSATRIYANDMSIKF